MAMAMATAAATMLTMRDNDVGCGIRAFPLGGGPASTIAGRGRNAPPTVPPRRPPPARVPAARRRAGESSRPSGISMSGGGGGGGGGRNDDNYDSMPSIDEIAKQKREAYEALSSFHETSSSLPSPRDASSSSSSSSRTRSLLRVLREDRQGSSTGQAECWSCVGGAMAYAVPMDPAAGVGGGRPTRPYRCAVSVLPGDGGGLRLVETIARSALASGDDPSASGGGGGGYDVPFVRSIPLGANFDVDPADGSYSLDDAAPRLPGGADRISALLPLLPPWMLGAGGAGPPRTVAFLVEHALATSETERCRCFFLYGDVDGDDATVVPEEETNEEEGEDDDNNNCNGGVGGVMEDDFAIIAARRTRTKKKREEEEKEEEAERSYRLLSVILAEETKVMPGEVLRIMTEPPSHSESTSSSSRLSSPLDLLKTSGGGSEDGGMDRLVEFPERRNERVAAVDGDGGSDGIDDDGMTRMERHPPGLFGLTSGVWLGDAFVREGIPPSLSRARAMRDYRRKSGGFGRRGGADAVGDAGGSASIEEDRFAAWHLGVQKVALRFGWDYRDGVSQSYTYGRVLGTPTSLSSMANIRSDGVVVLNESNRRASATTKERERMRVVWDMDGGSYVSGLVGSRYFRAPRYMSFSRSRGYTADAYLTEFMVFYRPEGKDGGASSGSDGGTEGKDFDASMEDDVPEYYCSRTSRLYDAKDGSLMQGSTAFFSLKRAPLGR
jgi:hypothetical protein